MSLRQIAKELGVSHSLLSLWLQGKRRLKPDIEAGYHRLVTTSGYKSGYKLGEMTGLNGYNTGLSLEMAGAGGSRTHRPDRSAGANGVEVRKAHRDPSAPINAITSMGMETQKGAAPSATAPSKDVP